jgi:hypothetical protein
MSNERRRSPRIAILGRVHGHVVSLDIDITVRDISLGGLSFESVIEFPVGAEHEFRLTLGDGATVLVPGRVVYCRPVPGPVAGRFVTGVEFVDDGSSDVSVGDFIGRIS